ncbi:hypothetical protein Q7C36_000090 [Tachysurus vachellii]|uniref:CUB domain-containing protein n=1 Tax=Tachysurus vachellii TaxID=175792 RepID=A0AA88TA49_TACVA|nr:hypothetical protein Q7C36_000090 [Tachysurus vachellii]
MTLVNGLGAKTFRFFLIVCFFVGVKCGGILAPSSSGNISSPNFPGLYPYNVDCSWLIVVSEGSSVLLTFHHFELEYHADCAYDYVKIYNGVSEDEGNLLGKFCGDATPPQFSSSWNIMSIIFHSDRHVARTGFLVGYRKDTCGGVLTGISGVISSPGYPLEYSNNAECSWMIQVSNRSVVTLVFLDFQLENNEGCNFDYIALFDGPTVQHRHIGNYCGNKGPPNTVSTSNQLLVVFKSDFNIGGRGFKAHYYSGKNSKTRFILVHLPPGYRIKLFFPLMELEDQNSLTKSCDFDSVAVYDGDSETDVSLGRWCGAERPRPLTSRANKLLVVLNTDRNVAFKGFSASYTGVVPVNVSCTRTEFQIQISQQALPQLDRDSVYLGNPSCSAQMTATSYKILARFVSCGTAGQKRQNITMLVNTLYIDFSDGKQQSVQEYEVQCDAQRKVASVSIISAEDRIRMNELARIAEESKSQEGAQRAEPEAHETSDVVFISVCVLAVILMLIAIVWLVLL